MITEKKFTRRHNFMRLIEYLNEFSSEYYFRGQSDSRWSNIQSTLLRLIEEHKKDSSIKDIEMSLSEWSILNELKGKMHLLTNEINDNDDKYSKLSFLQHNGMPTKIVDLTSSPFIALYFSLSEKTTVKHSTVYAINSSKINTKNSSLIKKIMDKISKDVNMWEYKSLKEKSDVDKVLYYNNKYKKNEKIITIYSPPKKNRKIIVQQGAFLIPTHPLSNLDDELDRYSSEENDFIKITYPREWCYDIYEYLNAYNINGEVLFPGLEGLVMKKRQNIIFDNYKLEKYINDNFVRIKD